MNTITEVKLAWRVLARNDWVVTALWAFPKTVKTGSKAPRTHSQITQALSEKGFSGSAYKRLYKNYTSARSPRACWSAAKATVIGIALGKARDGHKVEVMLQEPELKSGKLDYLKCAAKVILS